MPDTALRDLLTSSGVLGAELETTYRVLAVTIEPQDAPAGEDDPRRQVLFHPVGSFAASLRRRTDDGTQVLTFELDQLPAVMTRFEGAVPEGDPLPATAPTREGWGPQPSLEGRSTAPDGSAHHLALTLTRDDLVLELHASFDTAEVRDASGNPIVP